MEKLSSKVVVDDFNNIYEGEVKNGKPHGKGTYTFANGAKYVGELKDDHFHGQGSLTFPDGGKYVGGMERW